MNYQCPICGWPELVEPPRAKDGSPSFEICPCCGFEFGFDDDDQRITYAQWRTRWIAEGMVWWSFSRPPPKEWSPAEQVSKLAGR